VTLSRKALSATLAATLALSACGKPSPVDPNANKVAAVPPLSENSPSAVGAPPASAAEAGPIPAPLRGRWGLTPADCTSTIGDAKGLLVVSANDLKFYESRAVPGDDAAATGDSISGHFNFTGEGQTWKRYEALQLQKDGLVRTETNPAASFTYAKCR
jgi:hypothetical protein